MIPKPIQKKLRLASEVRLSNTNIWVSFYTHELIHAYTCADMHAHTYESMVFLYKESLFFSFHKRLKLMKPL